MVTSNTSTYYHNYYMYRDAHGTGLWEMLPWDMDRSLSVNAWRNHTYSSPPWTSDNPYLEKAILNPEMMNDIRVRVNEIVQNFFTSDIFIPMIDSLVAVLEPSVAQDTTDDVPDVQEWLNRIQKEKYYVNGYPAQLNWYFDNVQSSFVAERTPGIYPPDITFKWTPSVDPNGLPVYYNFFLTTGSRFQPEQTQVFENIQDTFLTIENIAEGNYYWKVISYGESEQEVESFDSRNPLTVKVMASVPCVISQNTTLFKGNSPYLVNCNVVVEPEAVLTIDEGVTLFFEKDAQLKIKGGFQVNGTKEQPVQFLPAYNGNSFDGLEFIDAQQAIQINYLCFTDGLIYSNNANIVINHCELIVSNRIFADSESILHHQFGKLDFLNSKVKGKNSGFGIRSEFAQQAIIDNSHFENLVNPILVSAAQGVNISNNHIMNASSNGISVNDSDFITIEKNRVFNCGNGIVTGSELNTFSDNIILKKNLIINCSTAIFVNNGCSALVDGNTLYKNETGIMLKEINPGLGGGQAIVVNSIISHTLGLVFATDDNSNYTVSYSICDNEILAGDGNLYGNPKFVSAVNNDFQLQATSPCIDTGDPSGPFDPDGTRADMGAFYFNQGSYNIIFNEINYKSSSDFDTEDWVELYNSDTVTAIISGWQFKDEKDDHIFVIPFGTEIEPGGFLVLCRNAGMFSEKHPDVTNYIGDFDFGLTSNGELIRLFNNAGVLINYVVYGVAYPWPSEPNGTGSTLELKNPFLDNRLPESWCASANSGTPGAINSCYMNTNQKENGLPFEATFFPNPVSDQVYIRINHFTGGHVFLKFFSSDGRQFFSTDKLLHGTGETLIELKTLRVNGVCLLKIDFLGNDDATHSTTIKFIAH
jgi:parallel beta-helix repeat protein